MGLILLFVMLPVMLLMVWLVRALILDNPTFYSLFGFLYFNVRNERRHRAYHSAFIMRKLILLLVGFHMSSSPPIFQIVFILAVNLASITYIGLVEPLKTRKANLWEIFNEFMISVITLFTLYFSGDQPDLEMQYKMGWVMIGLFTFMLLVNYQFIVREILNRVKLIYIKYSRKVKYAIYGEESRRSL